ncbi:MAG: hypothetical protein U0M02_03615 [Acutalibacteraceae bacterium]|nr:hypothetical protein [Acutalibacteraceae bacterium]
MSKNYGYIKLYRDIQGHYLWNEKPFDRARAFVDLVMLANHSDKKVLINGNLKEIKRGQIFTSRKKLADRWGWDIKKVDRFLRLLKGDETVTTDGTADGTTLTIENYSIYQGDEDTSMGHQCPTQRDSRKDSRRDSRRDTNNNDNNDNNVKIYTRHQYGEYRNVILSDSDLEKLKTEFPADYEERIEQLSCYIASTGKKYKNHLATIRNWARKDKGNPSQSKPTNATDDFMLQLQSMYE